MSENYTVLARKYRSLDFNTLYGQDVLVKTLTTAISTGRIAHAYIFTGIRGTGKTSTARILAKALNCLSADRATPNPCGECENCRAITSGGHIDVLEFDAASHTGVDNMRDILDASHYRPTNGRYKVYIIDEVHMLSTSAFNALLKTLEEPPEHVVFILATTEIRKVPVTILSRCQRFDLVRIPTDVLKKHLLWIAGEEKVSLTDGANELIARAADGSFRDGISLLDQAIAQTGGNVDESAVLEMLKRADRNIVVDFMATLLSGDINTLLSEADRLYNGGADLSMMLIDMMEWTHWATRMHPLLSAGGTASAPYTADQIQRINDILKNVSLVKLSEIWQIMANGINEMANARNQKQCFDMLLVRLGGNSDMKPVICDSKPQVPEHKSQITTANDIEQLLKDSREIMMLSHFNGNLEISEIKNGYIKYFDRKNDESFAKKLSDFLQEKTNTVWVLDRQEFTESAPTVSEQKHNEKISDPLVSDVLDLFGGGEVL